MMTCDTCVNGFHQIQPKHVVVGALLAAKADKDAKDQVRGGGGWGYVGECLMIC